MGRVLKRWGYSDNLPIDIKATYLITSLSMAIMAFYAPIYYILLDDKGMSSEAVIVTVSFLFVLERLSKQRYFEGKVILIIILMLQTAVVSMLLLNRESGMNYFFFTFTPAVFVLFDFKVQREKWAIIATTLCSSVFLVLSEVLIVAPRMIIADRYLVWMRASCILITIGVILYVYSFFLNDLEMLHAKLRKRANTDELTEVGNRRVLFETGSKIFSHGAKHQFALLIFDIDHFKKVNDTYGHPAGDEILKSLTRLVLDNISKGDILTRFGGEEFAVILQEIDAIQANQVAERLRAFVENAVFILQDGKHVKITISIGLTYFSRELESFDEMIRRSDIALYRAKDGGRNQVVVYNKA